MTGNLRPNDGAPARPAPRAGVLWWDHRDQPDRDLLARIVTELSADGPLTVHQPETHMDSYALIISTGPIGDPDAFFYGWVTDDDAGPIVDLT